MQTGFADLNMDAKRSKVFFEHVILHALFGCLGYFRKHKVDFFKIEKVIH